MSGVGTVTSCEATVDLLTVCRKRDHLPLDCLAAGGWDYRQWSHGWVGRMTAVLLRPALFFILFRLKIVTDLNKLSCINVTYRIHWAE